MARPDLVTRLGPRSGQELADLFHAARVFAYPSVYEGFGIPVLEAMSAGIPVVSTTDPAVVEVAGGAADLVPVGDADALAAAIARCWDDRSHRATLVAAGAAQASRYSWEACVDGLVALYGRIRDSEGF
jgi:alpha-1,3-rhamnosyl/mannosyltransferase